MRDDNKGTTLVSQVRILWIGEDPIPPNVQQAGTGRWELLWVRPEEPFEFQLKGVRVALVCEETRNLEGLLMRLQAEGIVPILLDQGPEEIEPADALTDDFPPLLRIRRDVPADQLFAMLETVCALNPLLQKMKTELDEARGRAQEVSRTAEELDEEMRLASRLQQDFLPRQLPKVGKVRFSVRYHAASWVSGDIYDITRLDETHVGFYVADAVGHGLPAALLTMFIKKALQTKRISGHSYEIIPPHEALGQLNIDLYRQKLSMCEFCTVAYGVINTETLMLTLSRAGHPAPILMHPGGQMEQLDIPGSLLGILNDARFESRRMQLATGDRLLLFSDGAEETICGRGENRKMAFVDALVPLSSLPREEFLEQISETITQIGSHDDVTLLLVEVQ